MKQEGVHLTFGEIMLLLRPESEPDVSRETIERHLSGCPECQQVTHQFEEVTAKLGKWRAGSQAVARTGCPEDEVWSHLAAGLLAENDTRRWLEHACVCDRCGILLREGLEDLSDDALPESGIERRMKTTQRKWQQRLAQEIVSRRIQPNAKLAGVSLPKTVVGGRFPTRWVSWATAALVMAIAGVSVFLWLRPGSADKLLRQAYATQRTLELRIPGAGYGPIRVQRGPGHPQHNSSTALLEAELTIKRGLEKQPENPDLLRAQAEADLLNWEFQPAIETLGHASRLQRSSPPLLLDLASAYFERAEATDSPADYEMALQHLGEAIRLAPNDRTALFNRAIVYERLFLYGSAITDWEKFLSLEEDPEWRNEAETRLREVRQKQHSNSSGRPAQPRSSLELNRETDAEEYLARAERELLPSISQPNAEDNYQTLVLTGRYLQRLHGDRFLNDLLRSAGAPGFHAAARFLAEASTLNGAGRSGQAQVSARRSARLFRQLGSPAGMLAAEFEEAYALQLENKAGACTTIAAKAASGAQRLGYAWVETQSLLEEGICARMRNDVGAAKSLITRALEVARAHDYEGFYLRGLRSLARMEVRSGDETSAWSDIRQGLRLYWSGRFPPMRGYSFYKVMEDNAEMLGHHNVQFVAGWEALTFISGGPDQRLEAATRSRLAAEALLLGETKIAADQSAKAVQLFSSMPQTAAVRSGMLEAEIWRAKAQSIQSSYSGDSLAALLAYSPEVGRLSNRIVQFRYHSTLAELQWKRWELEAAERSLVAAIALAESGLRSLPSWPERLTWMNQHRDPYVLLTELMFRSGRQDAALQLWQRFRSAAARPPALPEGRPLQAPAVLTYAVADDGVMLWLREPNGLHSAYISVGSGELRRVAENFLEECSRPGSDFSILRADARALYAWLLAPLSQWLPRTGSIVIEPDRILCTLPFEALIDEQGSYLGTRYSVIMGLPSTKARTLGLPLVRSSDRVLLAAAPIVRGGNLPPAQALREADLIARRFLHREVLSGSAATLAALKKELGAAQVFHVAGHATVDRNGAAIVMADGEIRIAATGLRGSQILDPWRERERLRNMKLAVFSACATARPSEALHAESLVSNFIEAGVPWVTASRWDVDSAAATSFMVSFYDSLLSGHTVDSALQVAAGDVRNSPAWKHPYYWAAFGAFGHS